MYSKADTHLHTTYSDGKATPEEIVDYVAHATDVRVLAVTDHDTTEGAFVARDYALRQKYNLEIVIGQEVTTDEGDVVGLFLQSTLPAYRTARRAIDAIHAQGGLAIAVHPFSKWVTMGDMAGLGLRILELPLDGVEVCNGFPTNLFSNWLTRWVHHQRSHSLSMMGGSDSHVPFTIGQPFTWFAGENANDLRVAIERRSTRVGGWLWGARSIVQAIGMVRERGLPKCKSDPVYAEELEQMSQLV